MEANTNPFPEVNLGLLDKARELGHRLIGLCSYYPESGYPSDHRGAAAMLDALSPSINEPTDGEAYEISLNSYAEVSDSFLEPVTDKALTHYTALAKEAQLSFGWDDQGNYFNGSGESL